MSPVPRSLLFTPGSRPDRFLKAASGEAQGLILDLEDAVAEPEKDQAREHVVAFLRSRPTIRQQIVVRINPLSRACGMKDLVALAELPDAPDCVLLPKAEEPGQIVAIERLLEDTGSPSRIAILIESARGVAAAAELAQASERLSFVMFGAADYASDVGQQVGVFRPDFARATIVNAAAAGAIVAIDSPFFTIDRPEELRLECASARQLGFYGKAAIHPSQLDAINDAFAPAAEELVRAQRIIDAAPDGVGVIDGKMVDIAMVRWARRILSA